MFNSSHVQDKQYVLCMTGRKCLYGTEKEESVPGDKNPPEIVANGTSDHETTAVNEQETQIQEPSPEHVKAPSDTIEIPAEPLTPSAETSSGHGFSTKNTLFATKKEK